jgi:2-oxoglutarate dehydrogenase E1 component
MQVCNLTTPAQYYHLLRKQMKQNATFKKPLVLMTPKSLLRHPLAVSDIEELANGAFKPLINDEEISDVSKVKRVVFCSGKVYYDLYQQREKDGLQEEVAIVRLEQFYPYPDKDFSDVLKMYKNAKDIVWCQEEPKNMGAWTFVNPRLQEQLNSKHKLHYAGRKASASPAVGQMALHLVEQERLVREALG